MGELKLLRDSVSADDKEPPLRNVARLLRNIADNLEEGQYGSAEVCRGVVVLRVTGKEPQIFGLGDTLPAQIYMDLHAGAQQLMSMQHPERGA